jgi:hypothetical protein
MQISEYQFFCANVWNLVLQVASMSLACSLDSHIIFSSYLLYLHQTCGVAFFTIKTFDSIYIIFLVIKVKKVLKVQYIYPLDETLSNSNLSVKH